MITNVLIFLCIFSPAISATTTTACTGSGITKHYVFIDEKVKSINIDGVCASYGGIGATVPNEEINACLVSVLRDNFNTQFWWIGIFKIDDVWVTGNPREPVGWTYWAANNPDKSHSFCILKTLQANWASEPKGGMQSLICEVVGPSTTTSTTEIATTVKTTSNESTTGSISQTTTVPSTNTTMSTNSQVISTTTGHSTTTNLSDTTSLSAPDRTSSTSEITTSTSRIETTEKVYSNGTTSGTSQTTELTSSTTERTTTTTSIDSSAFANTTNRTAIATNAARTTLSFTSATTNSDTMISTKMANTEETGVTASSTTVTFSTTSINSKTTSIGISKTSTTEMAPTISTAKSDTSVMLQTEESTSSVTKQTTNTPTSNTDFTTYANRTVKTAIPTNTTPTTLASTAASRNFDIMVSTETSYSGERVTTGVSPSVTGFTTSKKSRNTAIESVPLFPQPNKCHRHCPRYRNIEGNKITMYRINRKNTTRYRRLLNSIHYHSPVNDAIGVVFVCLVFLLYFVFILPDLKAVWMHVRHGVHPRTSQPRREKPKTDA